jgi:hypothetical protein
MWVMGFGDGQGSCASEVEWSSSLLQGLGRCLAWPSMCLSARLLSSFHQIIGSIVGYCVKKTEEFLDPKPAPFHYSCHEMKLAVLAQEQLTLKKLVPSEPETS